MNTDDLLLLHRRPLVPTYFRKKGEDAIAVPLSYYKEQREEDIGVRSVGEEREVNVEERRIPDFSFANEIPLNGAFSLFIEKHQDIAGKLSKLLIDQPDIKSLMSVATYIRDRVNPFLFQYAYSVALNHRADTKDLNTPLVIQLFPDQFVDPAIIPKLRIEMNYDEENRKPVEIPRNYTASDDEPEQRMAYFREDIAVNSHHWHWHLVYPGRHEDINVVNKDRRGELFFEMHSQMIARYNVDRLANGLPFVKPFSNFREPLAESYFPKMIRSANNRTYCGRPENSTLKDLSRKDLKISVHEMELWRDRIMNAIDSRSVLDDKGNIIKLTEETGIDILGNLIEPSRLSLNREYYGTLHNMGHVMFSYIHDPDGRHLEDFGVFGDVSTACRDPGFYRWHAFVDDLFQRYKRLLPEYPRNKLEYQGIKLKSMDVQTIKGSSIPPNILFTCWQKSKIDLSTGLDFGTGSVYVSFVHLQHVPFKYNISVTNSTGSTKRGTCRIYCVPKLKERGLTMTFEEKRDLMIEMDKFTVTMQPGENNYTRQSTESSITLPYERFFGKRAVDSEGKADRFCSCGWPQHMLLPKGTSAGMAFEFVVQISNFDDDMVDSFPIDTSDCGEAHSFCGLRDKKYPDKRAMGYPFDRKHDVKTLDDFVKKFDNFGLQEVSIKFTDRVLED